MPGSMHFERHASTYEQARPPYPASLWARVADLGALQPGRHAVDLGAGTGQATGVLLDAGLDVVAVEPGRALAARLRQRHPAARVIESSAETAELPDASFHVAVAATSIHWMDLDVLLPRLHRALVPGGWFLVLRNVYGDEEAPITPFRRRVEEVVARRSRPSRRGLESAERTEAALTRAGLFETVALDHFRWSVELDEQQVRLLFGTFSDWSAPEVDEVAGVARDLGGTVTEHYRSWLIALRSATVTGRR